jgi:hypothetical protein
VVSSKMRLLGLYGHFYGFVVIQPVNAVPQSGSLIAHQVAGLTIQNVT